MEDVVFQDENFVDNKRREYEEWINYLYVYIHV